MAGSLLQIGDFLFVPPVYYEWLSESLNLTGEGSGCMEIDSWTWKYKVYLQGQCDLSAAETLFASLLTEITTKPLPTLYRRLTPEAALETWELDEPGQLTHTDLRLLYTHKRTMAVEMHIKVRVPSDLILGPAVAYARTGGMTLVTNGYEIGPASAPAAADSLILT